jgi:predicted nucleic acid-binding protein
MTKSFIDSNVLLYVVGTDFEKSSAARSLLEASPTISVQVLNEFISVSTRKYRASIEAAALALMPIRFACDIAPLTLQTHLLAVEIAREAKISLYDACIVAAAELAGCDTLYTEDLNDGQRIGSVTIRNPFM